MHRLKACTARHSSLFPLLNVRFDQKFCILRFAFCVSLGDLAQLVEHLICIQRVRSSNLLVSINAVIAQLVRARH
jgi:hypothetical protein